MSKNIVIGISIGDINGIGPEIIVRTFLEKKLLELYTPIVYANKKVISHYKKLLDANDLNYQQINDAQQVNIGGFNIINTWKEEVNIEPGIFNAELGKYAFQSLEMATDDLIAKKIDALVTAPLNKFSIQGEAFNFPGHTEYLAAKDNNSNYMMLMTHDDVKVGVVTGHIPLEDVKKSLSIELILNKLRILNKTLIQDFGIRKPKIAVLGLNPHAGENGLLGKEELEIINPAIAKAFDEQILAMGPFPADGLFGSGKYAKYDAVLAMYHDQGLIPFKTISFGEGVNYTAGLSFIRTSPDHGTAYDLVGKNEANINSFRKAIYTAADIVRNRATHIEITKNPLKINEISRE
jgi:4-hydroxythreonine-4-phosphate dehydrogenase